ncbi:hypothetical protein KTR9_5452 (plasmid) [Gordonia sp. KTR9]|nr:hypothetical protein KTR9_5452 [Gordonia sp. KTR9]
MNRDSTVVTELCATPRNGPPSTNHNTRGSAPLLVAARIFCVNGRHQSDRTPTNTFPRLSGRTLHCSARHTYSVKCRTEVRDAPQRPDPHTLRSNKTRSHSTTRNHVALSTRSCEVLRTGLLADARKATYAAQSTHVRMHRHILFHVASVVRRDVPPSTGSADAVHVDRCTYQTSEHIPVRSDGSSV